MNIFLIWPLAALTLAITAVRLMRTAQTPMCASRSAMYWRVVLLPWWLVLVSRSAAFYVALLNAVENDSTSRTDATTAIGLALALLIAPMLLSFKNPLDDHDSPPRDAASRMRRWNIFDRVARHTAYRMARICSEARCVTVSINLAVILWAIQTEHAWITDTLYDDREYLTLWRMLLLMTPAVCVSAFVSRIRLYALHHRESLPTDDPISWRSESDAIPQGMTSIDEARRRLNR